jgi:hypothetical protein
MESRLRPPVGVALLSATILACSAAGRTQRPSSSNLWTRFAETDARRGRLTQLED